MLRHRDIDLTALFYNIRKRLVTMEMGETQNLSI